MAGFNFFKSVLLLTLFFYVSSVKSQNEEADIEKHVIRLPALGRTARLGSLYNASTEMFTEISILNKNLPVGLTSTIASPSTNTRFGVIKGYSDKSELLDVSAALTLSILSGKVEVSGSGHYMHDEQKKANSVVGSLSYETLTYEDVLEIFYDEMRDYLNPAVLENATESHVVIGIGWGANVIVKFEDQNSDNKDITEIQGAMSLKLNFLSFGVSGEASVNISESNMEGFANYSLQVFGDINLDASDYPTDVTKVINLIEKIPRLVNNSNEGKGKQLFFYLLPVQKVKDFLNYNNETTAPAPVPEIPPEEVASQIVLFEEISIVKLKLNDLYTGMMRNRDILNNTDLHLMHDLRNDFNNNTVNYRKALRRSMTDYSSGKLRSVQRFRQIERIMRDGDSSLEIVENTIDNEFREARLKIELSEFLRSQGAIWVGRGDAVDTSIIKIFKKAGVSKSICSIHFYHIYLKNTILFVQAVLEATKKGWIPLIVDCDFPHSTCDSPISQNKTCTQLFIPATQPNQVKFEQIRSDEVNRKLEEVKEETQELQKQIKGLKKEIKEKNHEESIPIGFVYTELPGQSSPSKIWPQFTWTDKSGDFAGDFFRVVGGNSEKFGATQPSSSGGLRQVSFYKCALGNLFCSVYHSIEVQPEEKTAPRTKTMSPRSGSNKIPLGGVSSSTVFVDFVVSSDVETRPVNKAVRIWERTA